MKCFIVGGAGFIGSALRHYFERLGWTTVSSYRSEATNAELICEETDLKLDIAADEIPQTIFEGMDVVIQASGLNAVACAANPASARNGLRTVPSGSAAAALGAHAFRRTCRDRRAAD